MKYILDKKIFYINIIICALLVGSVIYTEGIKVIKTRTETISCPEDAMTTCKVQTPQGETIELQKGEIITINQFNQKKLNIANYGVWTLIFISMLINHYKHNKNYPIKKELKKIYKQIKEIKVD